MSSSSIGCPRWKATPTTSSPSRTRCAHRERRPLHLPTPDTLLPGLQWPGRGWRSRWRFRPAHPTPRTGFTVVEGVGQSSNRPLSKLWERKEAPPMKRPSPFVRHTLPAGFYRAAGPLLSSMTPSPSSTSTPRKRPPSLSNWTIPASSPPPTPAYGDGWTVTAHP